MMTKGESNEWSPEEWSAMRVALTKVVRNEYSADKEGLQ